MTKFLRIGNLVLAALVAGGASAAGQQAPSRSPQVFRGVFGPTESEEKLHERLFLNLSVYGAADDGSAFATGTEIGDSALQAGRFYQGAQTQLAFRRERSRSMFSVDGSSALRYYPGLRDVTTSLHSGNVTVDLLTAPRWRVHLDGGASYSPYFQLQLGQPQVDGPTMAAPAGQDFSVARQKVIGYGGGASVTWLPDRSSEVLFAGGGRYSQFLDGPDFAARSARVRYTRRLSRDFSLRLGYGDGVEGRNDAGYARVRNIDAGLNYSRGIVLSPGTSIGFSSGSAIVSTGGGQHFTMLGSAFLKHLVSPRWTAQAGVNRSLQSIPTTPRPFVTDTANGTLSGYLTRRATLRVVPAYAQGVDVALKSARYRSYSNQTRFEFAISRFWAISVEHFYYRYQFSAAADLSSGLPRLTRQGARAGLTLWAPVVR